MRMVMLLWWAIWCVLAVDAANDTYLLGVGRADITGPVVDLTFMGYAEANQIGTGLRQRLYSRAFIVADPVNLKDRIVYLVQDIQAGDTAVRDGVLKGLRALGAEYNVYTKDNVAVTGTHSHSGPGGWNNYFLHHISALGFDKPGWEAVVQGTVLSIKRAHESLKEGRLSYGKIRIEDANINRSILAYNTNAEDDREKYKDNVDKDLSLLRFSDLSGKDIGVLTFFATHGTSMHSNNTLVTGDNKGVAAYLLEKRMGKGFVAGFSQSNVGDVSPNVLGAYCEGGVDDGKLCRLEDETCGGYVQQCHARGPFFGLNDGGTKSCFEIGKRQADKAHELLTQMKTGKEKVIRGPIRSFHSFQNMSFYSFALPNSTVVQTCPPAFGYSFAAGTSDGPGIADFYQGINGTPNVSLIWPFLSGIIKTPTEEQRKCQLPKPILLDLGELHWPYEWIPSIVDIQLLRIGDVFMIISTGEATTMAGRRWKEAIRRTAIDTIFKNESTADPVVVLGGPSNTYSHYITTREEYQRQRYEAASTLFGQWTLSAYIHFSTSKLRHLGEERLAAVDAGPYPPINNDVAWNLIPAVTPDQYANMAAIKFGQVLRGPRESYKRREHASATFIGASPRNDFRLEGTYAAVQKFVGNSSVTGKQMKAAFAAEPNTEDMVLEDPAKDWLTVLDDYDWDLVFEIKKIGYFFPSREASVKWEIGQNAEPGRYRLMYNGNWKDDAGKITPFTGLSPSFIIS